jgi:hypothetical protein
MNAKNIFEKCKDRQMLYAPGVYERGLKWTRVFWITLLSSGGLL